LEAKPIVVLGAGGFGSEVEWVVTDLNAQAGTEVWRLIGFLDDDERKAEEHGPAYLGKTTEAAYADLAARYPDLHYHVAVGKSATRKKLAEAASARGLIPATLVHPSVVVAQGVEIGAGSYVGAGSVLCPHCRIGAGVLINTRCAIGHHATIGDYCTINPGAQVNGYCIVEELVSVGSNAAMMEGSKVGAEASVGACSFVIGSVAPGTTVIGVPARCFRRPATRQETDS